jgi:hypothetical protein
VSAAHGPATASEGSARAAARIRVALVTSDGCHFCRDARGILERLGTRFPLDVRLVDLVSDEGRDIARRWRVPFPPVLLIEGRFHGHGRISERKLARALEALAGKGA